MKEKEIFEIAKSLTDVGKIYHEYAEKAEIESANVAASMPKEDVTKDENITAFNNVASGSSDKMEAEKAAVKAEKELAKTEKKDNDDSDEASAEIKELSQKLNDALKDINEKAAEENESDATRKEELKAESKKDKDDKNDKKINSNKINLVTFKGSSKGIEVFLSDDPEVTFEDVFENLIARIEATKDVFKDVRCGIVLKGRKLSSKEEDQIVLALRRNMNISIDYINSDNFYSDESIRRDLKDSRKDYAETMYYHGTLRSGQALQNNASIVIFGDVNPGSEVVAGGNLIVMGSLRGIVQAGMRSNDAYIVAFDMNPKQLRIGDHIARAADEGDDERIKKPHRAYLDGDQICIEPIDGTFNLIEKEC